MKYKASWPGLLHISVTTVTTTTKLVVQLMQERLWSCNGKGDEWNIT